MKTSQAIYEALEAVGWLLKAMTEDMQDPDATRERVDWLTYNYNTVVGAYQLLEGVRDSLNEVD